MLPRVRTTVKVYVCPVHLDRARVELEGLTGQLVLGILDTRVSVSDKGEGEELHGEYKT